MKRTDTQRISYFDGQLLTARDLQDDADRESRLRGLQVRALHNTWGVALGFTVSLKPDNVVEVGPGVAYDCHGREIVSVRTLHLGLPPAPGQSQAEVWLFDLAISYRDREDFSSGQDCLSVGLSPREERPVWRWRFAGDVPGAAGATPARPEPLRLGEEIPLARFEVSAGGEISQPDFTVRRSAQGLVRPHIAGDHHTGELEPSEDQAAFSITVDTSEAGFSQTPYYFARLTMPNLLAAAEDPKTVEAFRRLIGPFVTLRNPRRDSFQLDVRFAESITIEPIGIIVPTEGDTVSPGSVVNFAVQQGPSLVAAEVNWMGIEPNGGCTPPLQLSIVFLFILPLVPEFTGVTDGVINSGGLDI